MQIRFILLPFISIILFSIAHGQINPADLDSLKKYSATITSRTGDFVKYEANERLIEKLEQLLNDKSSFSFPFDSVKSLSVLPSPDKKFKIITWAINKTNGDYEYFGYILFPNKKPGDKKFIRLKDNTEKISSPETFSGDHNNWFGAIYYKIIPTSYQGRRHYTLLGWKGNNINTTKKVIDVLTLRSSGNVLFGYQLFRRNKDKPQRIVFEFSSSVSMLLRYEKQQYHIVTKAAKTVYNKRKSGNHSRALSAVKKVKAQTKTYKSNMILFDRLTPVDPRTSKYVTNLEGQYQYYVPETNILDAFIFNNGKWVFTKDIDARNPPEKEKKKRPEYQNNTFYNGK